MLKELICRQVHKVCVRIGVGPVNILLVWLSSVSLRLFIFIYGQFLHFLAKPWKNLARRFRNERKDGRDFESRSIGPIWSDLKVMKLKVWKHFSFITDKSYKYNRHFETLVKFWPAVSNMSNKPFASTVVQNRISRGPRRRRCNSAASYSVNCASPDASRAHKNRGRRREIAAESAEQRVGLAVRKYIVGKVKPPRLQEWKKKIMQQVEEMRYVIIHRRLNTTQKGAACYSTRRAPTPWLWHFLFFALLLTLCNSKHFQKKADSFQCNSVVQRLQRFTVKPLKSFMITL